MRALIIAAILIAWTAVSILIGFALASLLGRKPPRR